MEASITMGADIGRVGSCRLVGLEQHTDERGSVSVVESGRDVGFPIRRVYYLHDLDAGKARGAHAHRALEQLVIAVHGSFTVTVDDGFHRAAHTLTDPGVGLYVGPGVWRDLTGFSAGAVCLVLASHHYDESDYHRDYDEFRRARREAS